METQDWDTNFHLALQACESNNVGQAVEAIFAALRPGSVREKAVCFENLASYLLSSDHLESAIQMAEKATSLYESEPTSQDTLQQIGRATSYLGELYQRADRYQDALRAFRCAEEKLSCAGQPECFLRNQLLLGGLLVELECYPEALEIYQQMTDLPDFELHDLGFAFQMAWDLLDRLGRAEEADRVRDRCYQLARSVYADQEEHLASLLFTFSESCIAHGRTEQAASFLLRCNELKDWSARIPLLLELAPLLRSLNRSLECSRILNEGLAGVQHLGPVEEARLLNELGLDKCALGDWAGARPCFDKALELCSVEDFSGDLTLFRISLLNNLARSWKAQNKLEKACEVYRAGLDLAQGTLAPDHDVRAEIVRNLSLLESQA